MPINQRILKKRTGAATVEMAVVLPLLILLLIGGFDVQNAYIASKKVDLAVYRAARAATIPGATDAEIRQSALDEFFFIKSRGVDENLNLTIHRSPTNAEVTAQIPVSKAAYLQPLIVKFGNIQRNYNRPVEFSTDSSGIEQLSLKPVPSVKGFNQHKRDD